MIDLENLHGLLPLLQRLDARLAQVVAIAESELGTANDPDQGLSIGATEIDRGVDQETPLFPPDSSSDFPPNFVPPGSRLATLQQTFGLSDFDLELVAIAIAPELDRRRIWQQIWSNRIPLNLTLDLDFFAQRIEITGAEIRNIALAAAFLAASEGKPIAMRHIAQAARREYQKMGKLLTDDLSNF